jgi:hypothetical protein
MTGRKYRLAMYKIAAKTMSSTKNVPLGRRKIDVAIIS